MFTSIRVDLNTATVVCEGDQIIGDEYGCEAGSIILDFEELKEIVLAIGIKHLG